MNGVPCCFWVLPEKYFGFLGDDFWFTLVFSFAWFDSGYMFGVLLVFLRPLVSDSHLFLVSYLLRPFPAFMSVYRGLGISRIFCVKVDLGSFSGGAGSGSDIAPRCPWRFHRRISWTRLWASRQVFWSRQCELSGGAADAAHLQGH